MNIEESLTKHIHAFLELKRLWQAITETLLLCSEKEIKNDLFYNQVLFSALDGLVVRFCNFTRDTYRLLNQIESNKPKSFAWSRVRGHLKTIDHKDEWLQNISRKSLEDHYCAWFPAVAKEGRDFPNAADFSEIKNRIEIIFAPIKDHRDTVVAHKDKKPKPATMEHMKAAFSFYEEFLGALYFLHSFGSYVFELGGMAADPKRSAQEFSELILMYRYERENAVIERQNRS